MKFFKKIKLLLIVNFFFLSISAYAAISREEIIKGEQAGNIFIISCRDLSGSCDFYAKNHNGLEKKEKIELIVGRTGVKWYGDSLIEFCIHLGSNDDVSLFFDFNKMASSEKGFENVIVVDSKNLLVAYPDHQDLIISSIYHNNEKNTFRIKRDFDASPEISIDKDKSRFLSNGDLFLEYTSKENNKDGYGYKKELIKNTMVSSF